MIYDVTKLPNVHMAEGAQPHPVLKEVLWELASKYPLWQFKATEPPVRIYDLVGAIQTSFTVSLNSEKLGTISRTRSKTSNSAIAIACKRIADKMARRSCYITDDPKKAIAKVRKEFVPMTVAETIQAAMGTAIAESHSIFSDKRSEYRNYLVNVQEAAIKFCKNDGHKVFVEHLERTGDRTTLSRMNAVNELSSEMMTISSVRDKIGKAGSALVVLDEGKYLVKILDDLQLYDDTTLPQYMREKLGLLKLVQPKQFISSAGYRVSEEVFVIDLEAQ